jgi:hypothetical protein
VALAFLVRWGRDLPQGSFAILVGQAKRLALNPPTSDWGRTMLAKRGGYAVQRCYRMEGRNPTELLNSPPGYTVPTVACARKPSAGSVWGCHHSLDIGSCRSDAVTSSGGTEQYNHVRMEAKRNALQALDVSTKAAGYDTNHETNPAPSDTRTV